MIYSRKKRSLKKTSGGGSKHKKTRRPSTKRRLSLDELDPKKFTKLGNSKYKNINHKTNLSKQTIRKSMNNDRHHANDKHHVENQRIVDIVERLFIKFKEFNDNNNFEDDPTLLKDEFQKTMCKDELFKVKKTICGVGSYKVVILCKENIPDCKYVFAFDFKHHPKEDGDEKFMPSGRYGDLSKLDNILSIAPIFHRKLYCGYKNRQRVDFMLLHNNGNELFNFLYMTRGNVSKYKMGTKYSLWLGFIFLMTCLYSIGVMHQKGYVHRDLKPENMLVGNPNNPARNFLTVTDYGFVVNQKENKYGINGTPEYLTPKISKIYESLQSKSTLKFVDLIEHDLHSIGYNLIQILISEVFSKTNSKADCANVVQNCGEDSVKYIRKGKNKDEYCDVDAMTYIACNDNVDGTLGERKYVNKLKQHNSSTSKHQHLPYVPQSIVDMVKKHAIILADFGFGQHLQNASEGNNYAINMFYRLSREMKKNKADFEVVKSVITGGLLKVRLNPAIWKMMMES